MRENFLPSGERTEQLVHDVIAPRQLGRLQRGMSPKILLVENIHPVAHERLEAEGFEVDRLTHAPDEAELLKLMPKYHVLGIRSKTELTKKLFDSNPQLWAVGAFCIGTNQIDLKAA